MVRHEISEDAGHLTVSLHGELDWGGRLRVEPVFEEALARAGERPVTIDLRQTSFVDSSGVSLLIETAESARAAGTQLEIVRPAPQVFRVFEVLGLDGVLPFADAVGA